MNYISVTQDLNGLSGIVQLNIGDIAFMESNSRLGRILMHTIANDTFYTVGSLKYWTMIFNNTGYRFFVADRNNSVHIDNIVELNSFLKLAYFERDRTHTSKFCTMSKSGYKEVVELLGVENSIVVCT